MPARVALLLLLLLGSPGWPVAAFAAQSTQTFVSPSLKGVRLDWCRNWARGCGGPAAGLFCREMGFSKAASWSIDANVGARGIPTLVFGDGRLCKAPYCSSFRVIVCARETSEPTAPAQSTAPADQPSKVLPAAPAAPAAPAMTVVRLDVNSARFDRPQINKVLLDWCRHFGRDCGKPAADLFCREHRFDRANKFSIDKSAGARGLKTVVFGDGRICADRRCQAFQSITCVRDAPSVEAADPSAPPQAMPQIAVVRPKAEPQLATRLTASSWKFTSMTGFKPLPPRTVRLNWVTSLRFLGTYPSGASLYKCGSGDCSVSSTTDFEIDPSAATVDLTYSVLKVPHAEAVLWQVSYLPFPDFSSMSDQQLSPPGLVASGRRDHPGGWFSFDAREAAKKLPGGAKDAIFHVRVLPVAGGGEGEILGQPSNVMRAFYGARLPPQAPYEIYTKSEVPGSAPKIRLMRLEFEPYKKVERWPPGCQTWEEKYGDEETFWEELGEFFSGAWNWASDAYQWAKDQVVELAAALTFDLIPKDVFAFALDAALTTMGIPPDIPNFDQLLREGVDGLAKELAKTAVSQIPAADLATNVGNLAADVTLAAAAKMTEDQLRRRLEQEIETRSRDAIGTAADEMTKQLAASGKGKLCKPTSFHPVFKVTVANAGDRDYDKVEINAVAWPVYGGGSWTVRLRRGERTTLVATGQPILPHGPYSYPLLTEKERNKEDMQRWWNEVLHLKEARISVAATGALSCLGGDPTSRFCDREMISLHSSRPQKVTEPYRHGPGS